MLLLRPSLPWLLRPPLRLRLLQLLLLLLLPQPAPALVLRLHSLHSALLLLEPSSLRRPLLPRSLLLLLARRLPQLRHRPCSLIPVSPWRRILPWRILLCQTLPWRTLHWQTLPWRQSLPVHSAGWSCWLLPRRSPGLLRLLWQRPAGRRRLQRRCSTPGRPLSSTSYGWTSLSRGKQ